MVSSSFKYSQAIVEREQAKALALKDIKSIGCYYSYEKSSIAIAEQSGTKFLISGNSFSRCSIREISDRLKATHYVSKIWTNKHESLNDCFGNRLKQVDLNDENSKAELIDIYRSLLKEDILIFENGFSGAKGTELQAICLALKGLKYYQPHNYLLTS